MELRRLGRTGLKVSALGYGSGVLNAEPLPAAPGASGLAGRLLNRLLDAGVNYIDTSPDYGNSEELIGLALAGRRGEFVLATKCGCPDRGWSRGHEWTPARLLKNIEASLRRLRTGHVDVWQLHNPSPEMVKSGGLVEVMQRARRAGKVRFISVSSTLPDLREYLAWGVFDVFQLPYSALDRRHELFIGEAAAAGAGVAARGCIAEGEPRSGLARDKFWKYWAAARLDELRPPGVSRTAFLLRFALARPGVSTALVATRDAGHLEENLAAAQAGPLPEEIVREKPPEKARAAAPGRNVMKKTVESGPGACAVIGLDRRNAGRAAALAEAAVKKGAAALRLELCGRGRWSAAELEGLRKGLSALAAWLLAAVAKGRPVHLVNFEELDGEDGCGIFLERLLADGAGNYLLVPPQWRYDGRGLKLGHVDKGIAELNGCVYSSSSAACRACLEKRLGAMGYDAAATAEFDRGLRKALEGLKYLAGRKAAFKAYLKNVKTEKERVSGLLMNEQA